MAEVRHGIRPVRHCLTVDHMPDAAADGQDFHLIPIVLAARLLEENSNEKDKIEKAFRLIVCRKPTATELDHLTSYFEEEKADFAITPTKAGALLKVGEYPRNSNLDGPRHAAMMQVISAIYNLEEAITKS